MSTNPNFDVEGLRFTVGAPFVISPAQWGAIQSFSGKTTWTRCLPSRGADTMQARYIEDRTWRLHLRAAT